MSTTYQKRQTKETLGLSNVKGISVVNIPTGKKYAVKYRAEMRRDGILLNGGQSESLTEAKELANDLFKNYYGNKKAATKAGYWNN